MSQEEQEDQEEQKEEIKINCYFIHMNSYEY